MKVNKYTRKRIKYCTFKQTTWNGKKLKKEASIEWKGGAKIEVKARCFIKVVCLASWDEPLDILLVEIESYDNVTPGTHKVLHT